MVEQHNETPETPPSAASSPIPPDATEPSRPRRHASARLGRRLGVAVVWAGLLYIVAVGFATVLPGVFRARAEEPGVDSCEEGVRSLRDELITRGSGAALGTAPYDLAVRSWLQSWDARKEGLRPLCPAPHGRAAISSLERLRYRLETRMRRARREIAPILTEIDRELRSLESPSTAP